MSFKPVFQVGSDTAWYDNAQRFATHAEALESAEARYNVWTSAVAYDAVESDDPVNYAWVDGRDVLINREVSTEKAA